MSLSEIAIKKNYFIVMKFKLPQNVVLNIKEFNYLISVIEHINLVVNQLSSI